MNIRNRVIKVSPARKGGWKLNGPVEFTDDQGARFVVPAGFVVDAKFRPDGMTIVNAWILHMKECKDKYTKRPKKSFKNRILGLFKRGKK